MRIARQYLMLLALSGLNACSCSSERATKVKQAAETPSQEIVTLIENLELFVTINAVRTQANGIAVDLREHPLRLGTGLSLIFNNGTEIRCADYTPEPPQVRSDNTGTYYTVVFHYLPMEGSGLVGKPRTVLRDLATLKLRFGPILSHLGYKYDGVKNLNLVINGQEINLLNRSELPPNSAIDEIDVSDTLKDI